MLIGIGYAALSTKLEISGKVNIYDEAISNDFANSVYFSNGEFLDVEGSKYDVTSGLATQDQISPKNGKAASESFTSNNLAANGDCVVVEYPIQNDSDFDIAVTLAAKKGNGTDNMSNTNPSQFDIKIKHADCADWQDLAGIMTHPLAIPSAGEGKVQLKVTVVGDVSSATGATFSIEFDATEVVGTP